jgi:2-desacetyl-2-hydroxyethyl bacteriochlorophyllide A dehydrogenase
VKALVLKTVEKLEVMDVPMPKLAPGLVMVKVSRCGVCGSDIRYFHGENPWAKQTLQKEIPNPPNIILGHELTGTVVDVHDESERHLLGKRVGINSFITCGRCHFCRVGLENLCRQTKHLGHGQGWGKMDFYPGGMAEYCPAFASQVYELSNRVSDEAATFLDPIIAAMHAVDVAGPKMLDDVAIQGAGPIGLLIAQMVKIHGARSIAISDVAEENLAVAKTFGADHAVNVASQERGRPARISGAGETPALQTLLDAVMQATGQRGVQKVFNTVGSSESISESLKMLAPAGVVVLMATKDPQITIPSLAISGERTVKTSSNALLSDFAKAVELLEAGMLNVAPLVTHRFPLSRALDAFAVACDKQGSKAIKIIVDCQS